MEAAKGVFLEGIAVKINRLLLAMGGRDMHLNEVEAFDSNNLHVLIGQQVDVDLIGVVGDIEQVTHDPLRFKNPMQRETSLLFLDSQENNAAMGVGKGAVGGPEIGGQLAPAILACRKLALQINGF